MTSSLRDPRRDLLDELLRLAAAAGVTPDVAHDGAAALRAWTRRRWFSSAPTWPRALARARPAAARGCVRRRVGGVPNDLFRTALAIGAENVAELPGSGASEWPSRSPTWVTQLGPRGLAVGVVGGSVGRRRRSRAPWPGGRRSGPAVVIDADPLGRASTGCSAWESTGESAGTRCARRRGGSARRSLREALPRGVTLGVLTWYAGRTAGSRRSRFEALSAAQRGHDTVVLDLPRRDPLVEEVIARCDRLFVVVVPTVAWRRPAASVPASPTLQFVRLCSSATRSSPRDGLGSPRPRGDSDARPA